VKTIDAGGHIHMITPFGFLQPQDRVTPEQTTRGLHMLLLDGVCSQIMGVLTGGAFLVAFALMLGASNATIGLIAAIGPLTQLLQIPAIFLVDRLRRRKLLVVTSSFTSRLFWLLVAALPFAVPAGARVPALLISLFMYFGLGTISGCAFNSWMRDFVPQDVMGGYFGKRMAVSTAVGAALTVVAGVAVDLGSRAITNDFWVYSALFAVGAAAGLTGVLFLGLIPEPRMTEPPAGKLLAVFAEPFRDKVFRPLLVFLGSWNFAVNLAAPFFVVYMLQRLGMTMGWVLGLSVLSQITNVLFFRVWGRLADRFTNKSVLSVSGPMFIASIAIWPFTTMPEQHILTVPLLVLIHILAGMSTAGVNLCTANIALKLAPRGNATSFLATNALVSGAAATVAPIVAGLGADWFADKKLDLSFRWTAGAGIERPLELPVVSLSGLDFLFAIAVVAGLHAMHRLLAVREEGEVEEKVVLDSLTLQTRKAVRHLSNVAGLRHLTYFPYEILKTIVAKPFRREL
jgi:MFS family permease